MWRLCNTARLIHEHVIKLVEFFLEARYLLHYFAFGLMICKPSAIMFNWIL